MRTRTRTYRLYKRKLVRNLTARMLETKHGIIHQDMCDRSGKNKTLLTNGTNYPTKLYARRDIVIQEKIEFPPLRIFRFKQISFLENLFLTSYDIACNCQSCRSYFVSSLFVKLLRMHVIASYETIVCLHVC